MKADKTRIQELVEEYTGNTISKDDFNELCALIKEGNDTELKKLLEMELRSAPFTAMEKEKLESMLSGLPVTRAPFVNRKAVVRNLWMRRMAAAAVILAAGCISYFLFFNRQAPQTGIVKGPEVPGDVQAPATNRAMVTLADGSTVYLDSTQNGSLALQGQVKLVKLADGKISYQLTSSKKGSSSPPAVVYNTLTNPRGSKVIDILLSDGSHVWLNAGSSITYPVTFTGNERKVKMTGEAYFEVSTLPSPPKGGGGKMPFIVEKDNMQVEVLGTHFNVNTYDDEEAIRVTLLEGSVNVKSETSKVKLHPGEQAVFTSHLSRLTTNHSPDIEQVMAWKNGKFLFGEAMDIRAIMRQVSRWYDVDVEYKGTISGHIGGSVQRNVNASEVFKMLEMTGSIKFEINGRKVIVAKP